MCTKTRYFKKFELYKGMDAVREERLTKEANTEYYRVYRKRDN
jgi:hypothetical protein